MPPEPLKSSCPDQIEEERIKKTYAQRESGARYSAFDSGNLFRIEELKRRLLALLKRFAYTELQTKKIAEVGCGSGYWIRELIQWGARPENLFGIDLLPERIEQAKSLCPETVSLTCGNAAHLDWPDAFFDLVGQFTVFTSILDPDMKRQVAAEMIRILKPGGLIIWYDFHVNNPRNPDVRGVKKKEIHQLFSGCRISMQRITLTPPLSRRLAPYSWMLCHLLAQIPFLCTHYLGIIQKSPPSKPSSLPSLKAN
jgi:ubiquinone/menaquinone biosynthesis C-methylase UbiE